MANSPPIYPTLGQMAVSNFPALQPVSGPLTDAQLRTAPVPVSGTFYPATQPVSGTVNISNFPASQPVTGAFFQALQPVSVSSLPLPVGASTDAVLSLLVGKFFAQTSTITVSPPIPVNPNNVKIIAANPNRKGLYIYNNSANSIYVAFGSAANSATNMTQIIATFTSFILPFPVYQGDIYATRNAGSGSAIVTELT